MKSKFFIKEKDHFKLYIPLENKILFENELNKHNIDFYEKIEEQPNINNGIRYFLLDKDKFEIDIIIKENEILSGIESTGIYDMKLTKKFYFIYFKLVMSIIFIVAIIIGIIKIYDKLK
ncbi:hypothetical protein [Wenyingzhuangia aestuarii]|uniref:hypothetical protein n=1 Tax=Wenyingzhuangia aestuarii TaxID=1647582 RepID=UPI00143C8CAD|nr:hypothetical protein [Wenyingzhuangia aestuarii]NJB84190.1 hypothetical protein [Wenyingzhuangia aestuarii]